MVFSSQQQKFFCFNTGWLIILKSPLGSNLRKFDIISWILLIIIICSIIIYFDVDDGTVESFDPPLLFNVEVDPKEKTPLPNTEYRELLANISDALLQHMSSRRNKWLSQMDSRIIPYWFPCANFPHCFQKSDETSDFSDLFNL